MSAPVELAETYQYRATVTDASGAPVNAGTVTAVMTLPDGSTVTPTPANTGTGLYDVDYVTTQAGRHVLIVTASGGGLGTSVKKFDDVFHVEPPGRMLVGVDDAITQLRASAVLTSTADREQMRWLIIAASDAVERALGVVVCRRTITDTFDGRWSLVQLRQRPLPAPDGFVTITSVTEGGITVAAGTGYVVDRDNWALIRGNGAYDARWARGWGNITITYDAGCAIVPPVLRSVCLSTVEAMWETTQQASHPMLESGADLAVGEQVRSLSEPERMAWQNLMLSVAGIA